MLLSNLQKTSANLLHKQVNDVAKSIFSTLGQFKKLSHTFPTRTAKNLCKLLPHLDYCNLCTLRQLSHA